MSLHKKKILNKSLNNFWIYIFVIPSDTDDGFLSRDFSEETTSTEYKQHAVKYIYINQKS